MVIPLHGMGAMGPPTAEMLVQLGHLKWCVLAQYICVVSRFIADDSYGAINDLFGALFGTFLLKEDPHLSACYRFLRDTPLGAFSEGGLSCLLPYMFLSALNGMFGALRLYASLYRTTLQRRRESPLQQLLPFCLAFSAVTQLIAVFFSWKVHRLVQASGTYGHPGDVGPHGPGFGGEELGGLAEQGQGRSSSTPATSGQPNRRPGAFTPFQGQGHQLTLNESDDDSASASANRGSSFGVGSIRGGSSSAASPQHHLSSGRAVPSTEPDQQGIADRRPSLSSTTAQASSERDRGKRLPSAERLRVPIKSERPAPASGVSRCSNSDAPCVEPPERILATTSPVSSASSALVSDASAAQCSKGSVAPPMSSATASEVIAPVSTGVSHSPSGVDDPLLCSGGDALDDTAAAAANSDTSAGPAQELPVVPTSLSSAKRASSADSDAAPVVPLMAAPGEIASAAEGCGPEIEEGAEEIDAEAMTLHRKSPSPVVDNISETCQQLETDTAANAAAMAEVIPPQTSMDTSAVAPSEEETLAQATAPSTTSEGAESEHPHVSDTVAATTEAASAEANETIEATSASAVLPGVEEEEHCTHSETSNHNAPTSVGEMPSHKDHGALDMDTAASPVPAGEPSFSESAEHVEVSDP